jgi:hypothetical protein
MHKQVIFRDYQEQQAQDHNDIQVFARASFDSLIHDAVTVTRRFAGFNVIKSAQAEIQIAPGRFYDADGAVYVRTSTLAQSLIGKLPAVARRIISITASGAETETNMQERDFEVDADTGHTEPDSVPIHRSRDAVLGLTEGTESADPQPPAIAMGHVEVARILLDPIQIVSVTMMASNMVTSTEGLDARTDELEEFKAIIEPRVAALASDLAAINEQLRKKSTQYDMSRIFQDIARVKEAVEIPDTASDYGADRFLTDDESDTEDSQQLGHDAMIMEGIRFPYANVDQFELNIFSANDPNATLSNGLLLPAYTDVLKMAIGPFHSDLGMAQFGLQEHTFTQRDIARRRIRYGGTFTYCTNSQWWRSGAYDPATHIFRKDGETFEVLDNPDTHGGFSHFVRVRQFWEDEWTEHYWDLTTTEHVVNGAQVAQSFLNANDIWLTRIGFYLTVKAANEAVVVSVCEVTNGLPDTSKVIAHVTVPHGDLASGAWTRVAIPPTFLKGGKRYGVILTSNANHKIGMAYGQQYLDGTFFYSTDGAYYQGDLTKDMMLELWGARFNSPQVVIELEALNLDGGIRNIDLLAGMIVPESTGIIFEVQPNGAGTWFALRPENVAALNTAPPLMRFRARFDGTRDMHGAIKLTGSRCIISRPKTAFVHISDAQTLAAASDEIHVKVLVEDFDDTPHDVGCRLRVGAAWETADTIVTTEVNAADGRYYREFTFNLPAPVAAFTIEITGATNSAANTFHVSERVHWAA